MQELSLQSILEMADSAFGFCFQAQGQIHHCCCCLVSQVVDFRRATGFPIFEEGCGFWLDCETGEFAKAGRKNLRLFGAVKRRQRRVFCENEIRRR